MPYGDPDPLILSRVCHLLAAHLRVTEARLSPDTNLIQEFALDSLDVVELLMMFSREFGPHILHTIGNYTLSQVTVGALASYIERADYEFRLPVVVAN